MMTLRRRRRNRILYAFGGLTAAAAAAVFALLPTLSPAVDASGPATAGGSALAQGVLPAPELDQAEASLARADASANDCPVASEEILLTSGGALASLDAEANGPVEMWCSARGDWRAPEGKLRLSRGARLRVPASAWDATVLRLSDGSTLALAPGTLLEHDGTGLRLERGDAILDVPGTEEAPRFHFDDYELAVQPGGKAYVGVKAGNGYAKGGAPAPKVIVRRGRVLATGPQGSDLLKEGYVYTLDRYVTAHIPGRRLSEIEEEQTSPRSLAPEEEALRVPVTSRRWLRPLEPDELRAEPARDGE